MKIYVAGSFKNLAVCRLVGKVLRQNGFDDVYVFCDADVETFSYSMKLRETDEYKSFTPKSALENSIVQEIYKMNMAHLMKSDAVIMLLPCGNSAHMEAGWIKGADGGKLLIYGPMIEGQFDAMYGMADGVYESDQLMEMVNHLHAIEKELEGARA